MGGFDEVRAAAGTTASGPGPTPRWDSILSEHTALARAACGKASVISTMKPSGRYQNSPLDVCESPDSRYYADFFLFLPSHLFSLFPFSLYCFSAYLPFDIPFCIFSIFCPSHRIASEPPFIFRNGPHQAGHSSAQRPVLGIFQQRSHRHAKSQPRGLGE